MHLEKGARLLNRQTSAPSSVPPGSSGTNAVISDVRAAMDPERVPHLASPSLQGRACHREPGSWVGVSAHAWVEILFGALTTV